ncbi:MAG: alpha/beta hydrolase [Actinomycetota bacterium]|nr:alpha/beta hydrolase [Actinomycetota bacterium]
MADDAAGWAPLVESLAAEARTIAYDRRGYGGSGAPEPYGRTTVAEQAEDLAALVGALDAAPAVLCGRDLGALACLDVAKRHRALTLGLVLIDPPLYAFSAAATEALAHERVALEQWLRDEGPAGAVERWLGSRGASADRVVRARASAGTFFADYAALATWPVTRAELRALDVPTAILESADAPPHLDAAVAALAELLPDAERGGAEEAASAVRALLARTSA